MTGDSRDANHKEQIEVLGWSWPGPYDDQGEQRRELHCWQGPEGRGVRSRVM